MRYYPVLTIGANETSGGAGTVADLKTFATHQVYGMAVNVCCVIQDTVQVKKVPNYPVEDTDLALQTVIADIPPLAFKTGAVGNKDIIDCIIKNTAHLPNYVCDPAIIATTGDMLLSYDTAEYIKANLISRAKIITPNLDEAEFYYGKPLTSIDEMVEAGKEFIKMGTEYALVKGGHMKGTDIITDVLVSKNSVQTFAQQRIDTENTHGTGCTLAASIVSNLAVGMDVPYAVENGIAFVRQALIRSKNVQIGKGFGSIGHHPLLKRD